DGNFINYFSAKVFNDVTAPMSDAAGNACDTDDDNDSIADADEANGFDCGAAANTVTDPLDPDSDEDLVLDGAECILGTDPNNINSVPPVASCVASGDNDSDRMLDSREFCFYGTSASFTDSDNDGCTDGAEIASVNGDTKVDALDLAQIAQNFNAIGYTVPAPPHIVQFDVNRDRKITSIDLSLIAQQFNALRCM
ncbi:MAG TPA: dockerin type I domain-containing protein, partial [Dehalococcoidia bacterium]|nr:dockerin type I domain-containing protein [Dehalococcoidia bacterium]